MKNRRGANDVRTTAAGACVDAVLGRLTWFAATDFGLGLLVLVARPRKRTEISIESTLAPA
jgi:hypothetical protein